MEQDEFLITSPFVQRVAQIILDDFHFQLVVHTSLGRHQGRDALESLTWFLHADGSAHFFTAIA